MNIFYAVILGSIQGLTEFLPVSSSGHLALVSNLLKIPSDNLFFETVLHLGTLLAILIYLRSKIAAIAVNSYKEIKDKKEKKSNLFFVFLVIIGIIPGGLFGYFLNDIIEKSFSNLTFIGFMFIVTAILLYTTKNRNGIKPVGMKESLIIGFAQMFALLPGISRSGTTIATALNIGVENEKACDFSFFMAIPLILGAFLKEYIDVKPVIDIYVIVGFIASFITGYIAILLLYKILKSNSFYKFSYYLLAVGVFSIVRSII